MTVYAAFPWGEAVKAPGASQQIKLHRVAPNPLALPAEGTPQLVPVQAVRSSADQPALVDWLLLDAPLQHLRDGDDRWRLRVTVNGDSFLLDRQAPLWLRGLRNGSNSLLLELLDQAGQPLNPPFNSLVQEMVLASDPPRGWQLGALDDDDLQRLLGEAATPSAVNAEPPSPSPETEPVVVEAVVEEPVVVELAAPSPEPTGLVPSTAIEAPPAAPIPQPASPLSPPLAPEQGVSPMAASAPPSEPPTAPTATATDVEPIEREESPSAQATPPLEPEVTAARDLVNPDGSLIRPRGEGLVGRLRAKFGR
ncbi:hypothetical protein [Cyanobium sp. ATX-6F1]|uniref:hypothetical protein n=1 Tax=Cyanobium sp. ATX-6F1 TaxID=3137388 RepID=UPI0039BE62F0